MLPHTKTTETLDLISFRHLKKYIVIITLILEMLGRFLNLNKMKTKRLSNHMNQYFIHIRS